jgi:hypothetical protein
LKDVYVGVMKRRKNGRITLKWILKEIGCEGVDCISLRIDAIDRLLLTW